MKYIHIITVSVAALMLYSCGNSTNNTDTNPENTVGAAQEQFDDAVQVAEAVDTATARPIELGPDDILEFGEPQPYPVVVDFSASWCGPCKQMHPIFDRLANEYKGRVKFIYVDIDKAPQLAKQYGVEAVPTLLFVNTKGEINRQVGAMTRDEMTAAVESIIASSPQPTGKAPR